MPLPTGPTDTIAPEDDPLRGLPYRAIQKVRAGSMAEVFLAEHRQLGRPCVAKIFHAHVASIDPRVGDRIRLAAQALGQLSNPHVVSIIGAGSTHDERPFIVMEQLRGHTLEDELAMREPPLQIALECTCQLLRALAAAHAIGIVHRDIRPSKLFLCEGAGGSLKLKMLGFGIARVMPDASPLAPQPLVIPTDAGTVLGTPRYMSPEAASGKPVDHRADLYAAALVLYRMVAGRGPFDHVKHEARLLSAQASEEPKPPSHFTKRPIPAELDRVILRALRKVPDERFQSADEMRVELEQIAASLPRSSSPPKEAAIKVQQLAADPSAALPIPASAVRWRVSNIWIFLAAALITAAATARLVATVVSGR